MARLHKLFDSLSIYYNTHSYDITSAGFTQRRKSMKSGYIITRSETRELFSFVSILFIEKKRIIIISSHNYYFLILL
jgi:hypothetical protein